MKITIEPTTDQSTKAESFFPTVSVEVPSDHLHAEEAVELAISALCSWGFLRETIINNLPES